MQCHHTSLLALGGKAQACHGQGPASRQPPTPTGTSLQASLTSQLSPNSIIRRHLAVPCSCGADEVGGHFLHVTRLCFIVHSLASLTRWQRGCLLPRLLQEFLPQMCFPNTGLQVGAAGGYFLSRTVHCWTPLKGKRSLIPTDPSPLEWAT